MTALRDGNLGRFCLRRQKSGRGYFGDVSVRLAGRSSGDPQVVWRVRQGDLSSMQPRQDREFTDAALEGASLGVELVLQCGVDATPYIVEVVHVQLNLVDIEVSAVRAAGALAVADVFGVIDSMGLGFDGQWAPLIVPHMADLGPLTASVVRNPDAVRLLSRVLNGVGENGPWNVGDATITVDSKGGAIVASSTSGPTINEISSLATFRKVMEVRGRVVDGN